MSGSAAATVGKSIQCECTPARPKTSSPPARRLHCGTHWPAAIGGSSHSMTATRARSTSSPEIAYTPQLACVSATSGRTATSLSLSSEETAPAPSTPARPSAAWSSRLGAAGSSRGVVSAGMERASPRQWHCLRPAHEPAAEPRVQAIFVAAGASQTTGAVGFLPGRLLRLRAWPSPGGVGWPCSRIAPWGVEGRLAKPPHGSVFRRFPRCRFLAALKIPC